MSLYRLIPLAALLFELNTCRQLHEKGPNRFREKAEGRAREAEVISPQLQANIKPKLRLFVVNTVHHFRCDYLPDVLGPVGVTKK